MPTNDEIRARLEAATPGPLRLAIMDPEKSYTEVFEGFLSKGSGNVWGVLVPDHPNTIDGWSDRPAHGVVTCWTGNGPTSEANALLYLNAPEDLTRLLAENEQQAQRIAELETLVDEQTRAKNLARNVISLRTKLRHEIEDALGVGCIDDPEEQFRAALERIEILKEHAEPSLRGTP